MGDHIRRGQIRAIADLSLFRKFPIRERYTIELRAESFNFTNMPHFSDPKHHTRLLPVRGDFDRGGRCAAFQFGLKVSF